MIQISPKQSTALGSLFFAEREVFPCENMETLYKFRGFFLDRKGLLDYNRMDIEWVSAEMHPKQSKAFFELLIPMKFDHHEGVYRL